VFISNLKYNDALMRKLKTLNEPVAGTPESRDETKVRLIKKEDAKTKNSSGYVELLMVMTDEISFAIIDEAKTYEFPR
jgi:hypothetical protein